MKIAAPFSRLSEVEMLLHFGADELYCGINTPEWEGRFGGKLWINRRNPDGANLMTIEKLSKGVEKAHKKNAAVYVTLNAPFYPEETIGYILRLCEKLVCDLGVDGFIVADINLLLHIAESTFPSRIHLSSLGSCFNHRTAGFFKSLNVRRIILPRQLRLSEIETLVRLADKSLEFEVFALNDGCYFEEGFCQTSHALGPFCMTPWRIFSKISGGKKNYDQRNRDVSVSDPSLFDARIKELQKYLWFQNNCGSSSRPDGIPEGPCALCQLAQFRDWNITALKIVGREASFVRKMRSLQLLKAVVQRVEEGESKEGIRLFARSIRNSPDLCESGYMCYFRDDC